MSSAPEAATRAPQNGLIGVVRWLWFGLGTATVVANLWGIVDAWTWNPDHFFTSPPRQIGLIGAVIFGLTRIGFRDRLWPDTPRLRVLFRLTLLAVFWSTLARFSVSIGSDTSGVLLLYPPVAAIYALGSGAPGRGPGGFGIWIVRAAALLGATAWFLAAL